LIASLAVTELAPTSSSSFVEETTPHAQSEMGSPKDLTAAQVLHLNDLAKDVPETDKLVRTGPTSTIEFTPAINRNDIVLVKLIRNRGRN
jgi:hypothetical protein